MDPTRGAPASPAEFARARDLLARFVAHAPISSRPQRALAEELAQLAEDGGFRVELLPDPEQPGKAAVLARAGPPTGGGLTLSGHTDVVPAEGQPWTSDPHVLIERDGRLQGRGAADMLGFLAAVNVALDPLPLHRLRRPLALLWTYDEEVGCLGAARAVDALRARGERLPTDCLIGEPTGLAAFHMHAGHVEVAVETRGRAAHSSRPALGANALLAMGRVLRALEDLARELPEDGRYTGLLDPPRVPLNPAILEGGTAINVVPDRARLRLGYRPLPDHDPLEVAERIEERLASLPVPAGTSVHVRTVRVTPGMCTPPTGGLAELLAPACRAPPGGLAPFATDGGVLQRLGLRPWIWGPGAIEAAHAADESIAIDDLARAIGALRALVARRCLAA